MSFLRDLIESVVPAVYAEEPEEPLNTEEQEEEDKAQQAGDVAEDDNEEEEEKSEDGDDEEDDEDEDEDEDDEDDEDEEEQADQFDALKNECAETSTCKPYLHHYHECAERVTKAMEDPDYDKQEYKEDCIEEFFHLQHCINDCAAPKLFYKLK